MNVDTVIRGAAALVTVAWIGAGAPLTAQQDNKGQNRPRPFVVAEQGSFSVGGHTVQGAGVFDPTKSPAGTNEGQTFWVDQTYVQYQIPVNPRKYPLVLVHGGGGTGRVWESTPDGREGYQTIFLRRGFPVYIVDFARRGRAGQPTFNGPFGRLDGVQIVPDNTGKTGVQFGWTRWRIGAKYPDLFPVNQFPTAKASIDQFFQSLVPTVSDDATIIVDGLAALLDKIGPAIIVTHSQSGLFGWLLAIQRPSLVKAVVSYEPGVVFPNDAVPPPIPLYKGTMAAGAPVPPADFLKLTRMPLQILYGDNIPTAPIPDLVADGRRAQIVAAKLFEQAIDSRGGDMELLLTPDAGLRGNSHFMYSDLNNLQIADLLSQYLHRKGLDKRSENHNDER
jgi:pimeloyl-ACP methyl ester carboxylesterase